jgi:thioredoxin reductase (NADPH)
MHGSPDPRGGKKIPRRIGFPSTSTSAFKDVIVMLDCLIIGGGPAGLLAAVYLGRYCRAVRVIDAGESRAAKIPQSHNYPGFFGIGGPELLRRVGAQATAFGVGLTSDHVTSLRKEKAIFVASCSGADVYARFVLLATGLVDHSPPVKGDQNCLSEAIRFCPICDGYEAIDHRIGVLGNIKDGAKKALFLRTYTRNVTLFLTEEAAPDTLTKRKFDEENVRIVRNVREIALANTRIVAVVTGNGERHELDALYPALGCTVRSNLATALGASCTENGNLVVNDHQRTTVEGLYAAGDVVTDLHQLSVAFGHAAIAATDIHNRLPPNPR